MKKTSALSVALYIIVITSGLSCKSIVDYQSETLSKCIGLNERCTDDSVCCSQYCWKPLHIIWNGGICSNHVPTLDDVTYLDIHSGICEYSENTNLDEVQYLNTEFYYLNAAHYNLPPFVQIRVWYGSSSIIVTINDRLPKSNGTLLDLSYDAAKMLGINRSGYWPCRIQRVTDNYAVKRFVWSLTVVSLIVMAVVVGLG